MHIDLAVPPVRWGMELDIHPEHLTLEGRARDARRYRSLHLVEWQVEPVSEFDMTAIDAIADELQPSIGRESNNSTLSRAPADRSGCQPPDAGGGVGAGSADGVGADPRHGRGRQRRRRLGRRRHRRHDEDGVDGVGDAVGAELIDDDRDGHR